MKMNGRLPIVLLFVSLCFSPGLFAAPLMVDASAGVEYAYMTNSFADPVVSNTKTFIKRRDVGATLSLDMFFSDASRVGLSTSLSFRLPFSYTEQVGKGEPVVMDTSGVQALFGSVGPIFKVSLTDWLELAVAMRIQLGALDFRKDITLGLQTEARLTFLFPDSTFLSAGLHYDLHFRKYTPAGPLPYEVPFFMMTAAPFISGGVRFGGGK
jgi:hypothetical protein